MQESTNSSSATEKFQYCRLCASKCDQVIKVFGARGKTLKLVEKIKQFLQIKLSPSDTLPKSVCTKCNDRLQEFSAYRTSCSQAQVSLKILSCPVIDDESDSGGEGESKDETETNSLEKEENDVDLGDPPVERKRRRKQPKTPDVEDDLFYEAETSKNLFDVWKCTLCDSESATLQSLKRHHLETHSRLADFKCNKCNKVYSHYRSFARHVKLHSVPKRYGCDVCGKRFSQKTVLQSHSTVHSEERPHVCPQCGKAFKQFSSLYLHRRSHLPEQSKPKFACSYCDKRLSSKHTLDTHLKIHYGEKNFVCDVCGKRFYAKGSLNYHMMSHDPIQSHSCLVCGKGFKTASLLSKHSALHTGIKPHQCDVCGKQFRERSALKEHDRIHTGEMPYSCDICGKHFRFKGILTVHRRIHTGERPYVCAVCRQSFTNWANYNKHMKRRHKTTESPAESAAEAVVAPPSAPRLEVDPSAETTLFAASDSPVELNGESLGIDSLLKSLPSDVLRIPLIMSGVNDVGSYIAVMQPLPGEVDKSAAGVISSS